MRRLRGQVGRIIWCDPHAAAAGYQPQVQGLCVALPYVDDYLDFSSVRSLSELVSRVESAVDAETECFEIAYELAHHAMTQPGVAGLHFISFRKDAGIAKLCGRLGIGTKQERETHGHSPSVAVG